MEPEGTVVFTTLGLPFYGFDVFSVKLPSPLNESPLTPSNLAEHRLTDGISVNFNGRFLDDNGTVVFVSERYGSSRIFLRRQPDSEVEQLPSASGSLFHDRPVVKDGRLYFISAHEQPQQPFRSWSALYSTHLDDNSRKIIRLTPYESADFSQAISPSGKFVAVASYGSRPWGGEFRDLLTDIVVFRASDAGKRTVVCSHGGWPTWSSDSTIYFHRQADDGWWSIFRVDLTEDFELSGESLAPIRVTPPGLHCFTPAAFPNSSQIAIATRRRGKSNRHIEVYDADSLKFYPVTELLNPNFHHYNPFGSPGSVFLGYHRFRGESPSPVGDITVPHLDPVASPIKTLRMLRLNGTFPSFSPSGEYVAYNHDFDSEPGLQIVRSDGSKKWSLIKDHIAFYNSWSLAEEGVIFTAIGPIFESVKAPVQIARVTFDPAKLTGDCDEVSVEIKILTRDDTGNNAFPSCSPDGKSVVFRSGRTGHKNLYIIDAVNGEFIGGSIRSLTEGAWIDTMPSWSPDGELIAFSSNRHNPDDVDRFGISIVRPDGTGLRRIKVAGGEVDMERLNHVCFSADGQWLLFTGNLGGVTAEPVSLPNQFQPYGDLHVARLDGSGLQRLTWNGYENGTPAWHPRGDWELGALSLEGDVGEKLRGQFDEPLWITCEL